MKKNFALVLMFIICSTAISCNKVPADMFPKSVGAFQFEEGSKTWKDPKGYTNFFGNYVSPDRKISCSAFDALSEQDAVTNINASSSKDDTHSTTPILDKTGKQTGIKLLHIREGAPSTLEWNIKKRVYSCDTESGTEKTFDEFYKNWQDQTSK